MSQHDFDITTADANTGVTFRAAVNAALQALASSSSGATAPTTTYSFQFFADSASDVLKMRNAANTAWIDVCVMSTGRPSYVPSGVSSTEIGYLDGVTSAIQTQINAKAPINNPTFTGTVTLPSTTSIGDVSATELQYLNSVTSNVQDQINSKQATLVSGTNIKTINSNSLLGSGNITIGETTWVANDSRAKTALNASGSPPIYACRAWVNFNGTGTVAIRASGNVSSITDNGTGDYTVNFTTAMPDVNYAAVSSGQLDNAGSSNGDIITGAYRSATSHQTGSYRTSCVNSAGSVTDPIAYEIAIFR